MHRRRKAPSPTPGTRADKDQDEAAVASPRRSCTQIGHRSADGVVGGSANGTVIGSGMGSGLGAASSGLTLGSQSQRSSRWASIPATAGRAWPGRSATRPLLRVARRGGSEVFINTGPRTAYPAPAAAHARAGFAVRALARPEVPARTRLTDRSFRSPVRPRPAHESHKGHDDRGSTQEESGASRRSGGRDRLIASP